jgi:hypothetical protein
MKSAIGTPNCGADPSIRGRGWPPSAAGQAWLDRQQDRDEFSRSILDPDDHGKHSILHALSRDGRTTAVVYLLTNTNKGWRLQGENLCQ